MRPGPSPAVGGKVGVLLVNLGTPDGADAASVRRYLKEFLSDPRVIENQGVMWQLVLNGVILPIRPRRKARDYAKIWNQEKNKSPLKTITRSQAEKLGRHARAAAGRTSLVDWAMRYGNPSIASRLADLVARGCERILVDPALSAILRGDHRDGGRRGVSRARSACASSRRCASRRPITTTPPISRRWRPRPSAEIARLDFKPDVILASFHGVPKAYVDKGDPYYAHCLETMRLLRAALKLDETKLMLTFQSRFGRAQWLEPATDQTVQTARQRGREEHRGDHARLLRRLPGDAGGDRGRERAHLQAARRQEFRRHPLPQRQRAGDGGDPPARGARAQGLGVGSRAPHDGADLIRSNAPGSYELDPTSSWV